MTQQSLFQISIKFVTSPSDEVAPFEVVLRESKSVGHLRLGIVPHSFELKDLRTVRLPFVQMRKWDLDRNIPLRLLEVHARPWTADDFEALVSHYLCARTNFLQLPLDNQCLWHFYRQGHSGVKWQSLFVCR